MEFQRERVYTALNADELKQGDKVIVANDLSLLRERVQKAERGWIRIIREILPEDVPYRFKTEGRIDALAYLVERKENCTNCVHREGEGCKPNVSPINCCPCYDREVKQLYIEPKAEHKCETCKYKNCVFKYLNTKNECDRWEAEVKTDKHTDYNHCEEAKKAYDHAMTNACPEKHYRPFRDTDELIKTWIAKRMITYPDLCLPHIWVRRKEANSKGQLITEFGDELHVSMGKEGYNMTDLFVYFTFLDGSPCGVEA